MKRRALEGAYLLAFFEGKNKYDYAKYRNIIIEVFDTREDIFNDYYQKSLEFLQNSIQWYELKSSLRDTIVYFKKFDRDEYKINNYAENYFKQIEIEYHQKKFGMKKIY